VIVTKTLATRGTAGPDAAEIADLQGALARIAPALDEFLRFGDADRVLERRGEWLAALDKPLPETGAGLDAVLDDLERWIVPNGMRSPHPGFLAYIMGRATTASVTASLAAQVAGHFRYFLTSFNFIEQLSLRWLAELCQLPADHYGVYSSGGSTANLLAMGAARQHAFEQLGIDVGADGLPSGAKGRIYGGAEVHHTIHRAAGVMGLGRRAFHVVASDAAGRVDPSALDHAIREDKAAGFVPVAIVGVAGATATGAVDDLERLADVAETNAVWLHVDGAYGLPAACVPEFRPLFVGLARADSAIVDPHKWLGTPTGCAATFVRDGSLLERAFTQDPAPYLESFTPDTAVSQFDDHGPHWYDRSIELSSPARGAWVWAVLREVGVEGVRDRVRRHVDFANHIAGRADSHPRLELLLPPSLSICCFRYRRDGMDDEAANAVNERIMQGLRAETSLIPSTAMVGGKLAIRPVFVNPATTLAEADGLVDAVLELGDRLTSSS
jgi:aromatic-L-amino-acid decarboxylase